ncbi:DUF2306 domain-containing protein [Putridiphycobacter roseus]|uniref:DUF2306 domain-containing protein n=1 Tax=Putridiphycobacter roseus TaxID=2219161 RepID=A0A2W1MY50_9FLAO|nr:DUF2306 domain-containing protein [Putridiphycobacter roseus]PZE16304.1 DUF2306 domain-containing protein [Putridiphycobacter roseus]
MDATIKLLIIAHVALGGIALLTGLLSIIAYKGKNLHKKSGKFFVYTMISSGLIAMVIALLPKHESPFLFSIGIFSTYLTLTGYRALRFKRQNISLRIDITMAWLMVVTGFLMIILPTILTLKFNIVLGVFGILGISLAIQDLKLFSKPKRLRKGWLKLHIGKIMGGYISAVTAFIVVNQFIPGIYGWLVPTLIGSVFIAYWMRRVRLGKVIN